MAALSEQSIGAQLDGFQNPPTPQVLTDKANQMEEDVNGTYGKVGAHSRRRRGFQPSLPVLGPNNTFPGRKGAPPGEGQVVRPRQRAPHLTPSPVCFPASRVQLAQIKQQYFEQACRELTLVRARPLAYSPSLCRDASPPLSTNGIAYILPLSPPPYLVVVCVQECVNKGKPLSGPPDHEEYEEGKLEEAVARAEERRQALHASLKALKATSVDVNELRSSIQTKRATVSEFFLVTYLLSSQPGPSVQRQCIPSLLHPFVRSPFPSLPP